ncbi:MAG: hypothetical protein J2P37_22815 [Ktedonobacteraceae bacterium]|nr:hypothetical protein [Ktedonobacteraceae bacterium]
MLLAQTPPSAGWNVKQCPLPATLACRDPQPAAEEALAAHRLDHGAGAGSQMGNVPDEAFQSVGVLDDFELEANRRRSQMSQTSQVMFLRKSQSQPCLLSCLLGC